MASDLSELDLVAIQIDGLHLDDHRLMIGAVIPIQRCQIHKARTIIDRLPLTVCLPSIMPPWVAP